MIERDLTLISAYSGSGTKGNTLRDQRTVYHAIMKCLQPPARTSLSLSLSLAETDARADTNVSHDRAFNGYARMHSQRVSRKKERRENAEPTAIFPSQSRAVKFPCS